MRAPSTVRSTRETVCGGLDEAHRDRSRRERARAQQHCHENQQADRRRPRERHERLSRGCVAPAGRLPPLGHGRLWSLSQSMELPDVCPHWLWGHHPRSHMCRRRERPSPPQCCSQDCKSSPFITWSARQPDAAPMNRDDHPIFSLSSWTFYDFSVGTSVVAQRRAVIVLFLPVVTFPYVARYTRGINLARIASFPVIPFKLSFVA